MNDVTILLQHAGRRQLAAMAQAEDTEECILFCPSRVLSQPARTCSAPSAAIALQMNVCNLGMDSNISNRQLLLLPGLCLLLHPPASLLTPF